MGFEGVRENFVPVLDSDSQWGISKTFKDTFSYKISNNQPNQLQTRT